MSAKPTRRLEPPSYAAPRAAEHRRDPLVEFLTGRLTDDLARVWARDAARADPKGHPGMAAQVAVIDELLTTLRAGRLPSPRVLRILLYGYGSHPDYDPAWTDRLLE